MVKDETVVLVGESSVFCFLQARRDVGLARHGVGEAALESTGAHDAARVPSIPFDVVA